MCIVLYRLDPLVGLISAWEPGRKSNRIRYDLFETDFLDYLKSKLDWKAVAREKDSEALKKARHDLNLVRAELDQAERLLARRTEQARDPNLPDAVVAEYYTQMAEARTRIATLGLLHWKHLRNLSR
jgi:hypothetical protein